MLCMHACLSYSYEVDAWLLFELHCERIFGPHLVLVSYTVDAASCAGMARSESL